VGLDVLKNNSEKTIEYVGLQAQTGKSTIKSNAVAKEKYLVKIKNGEAVWDSETMPLLRRLKVVYGCTEDEAKELIKKSGMLEALAKSVESSIDGDNKSAEDDGLGLGNGEHWYDEQVRSFVIKEYETVIETPEILVNDKIDYNAGPKQTGALFSNGYRVDWKLSITLANRTAEPLFGRAKTELLIDKTVQGASFIVADATTSDMRR
jgi:hypothetical protein